MNWYFLDSVFSLLIEEEHVFRRAARSSLFWLVFLKRSLSGVLCASFFVLESLIKAVSSLIISEVLMCAFDRAHGFQGGATEGQPSPAS